MSENIERNKEKIQLVEEKKTKVEDKKSPEKKAEKSFEDITIKKWTDEERAAKRAARFEASQNLSNLTEAVVSKDKDLTSETKKQSRAERFGLSTKIGGAPSADLETLKKRAERFGQSSSSVMKKAEMDEKGTIHILRKHFYSTKLDLTSKFFTKTDFFRQIKRISFSTLHFDKIFML
mgnify:CR=1 FL=1